MTQELNGFILGQTVKITDRSAFYDDVVGAIGTISGLDVGDTRLPYRVKIEGHAEDYVKEDGTWVSSVEAVETEDKLKVGDRVVVASGDPWIDGDRVVGRVGTLTRIDKNDDVLPYNVIFDDNVDWWVTNVRRIDTNSSVATKTVDEVQAEFDAFRRKVVEVALHAAEESGWCEVVNDLLKDELGLADYYPPKRMATITIRLDEEGTNELATYGDIDDPDTAIAFLAENGVPSESVLKVEVTEV